MPIVSKNIRIRYPDHFKVGEGSIVDDYSYFSTRVEIGRYSHIASGCSIAGGPERLFVLGDFSSLSSGVKIWCASDDFVNDLVTIIPPETGLGDTLKDHFIVGDVHMGAYTAVGSNSVVMPKNRIPEGTVIGALSFVPSGFDLKPWSVYAGNPLRYIKKRNQKNVLRQAQLLSERIRQTESVRGAAR